MTKINAGARLTAKPVQVQARSLGSLWKKLTGMIVADGTGHVLHEDDAGAEGVVANDPLLIIDAASAKRISDALRAAPNAVLAISIDKNRLRVTISTEYEDGDDAP